MQNVQKTNCWIPTCTFLPMYVSPWGKYERTNTSGSLWPIFFTNACVLYINRHFEVCMPTMCYLPSEFHFWKHGDTSFNLYFPRLHRHSKTFCIYRHFKHSDKSQQTSFYNHGHNRHAVYLKSLIRILLRTFLWPLVSELHIHQKLV